MGDGWRTVGLCLWELKEWRSLWTADLFFWLICSLCEYGMSAQVGSWNTATHISLFLKGNIFCAIVCLKSVLCFLIVQNVTRQYFVLRIRGDFGYCNSIGAVNDCEDHEVRLKAFSFLFLYFLYLFFSHTVHTDHILTLSTLSSSQLSHCRSSTVPFFPSKESRPTRDVN